MNDIALSFGQAFALIRGSDPHLWGILWLSLEVSFSATVLGALVGLPLGAILVPARFPGRRAVIVFLNGLLGLPTVVVGLLVYLLLSRAGPLGSWGILFTPTAIVIAQSIIVIPIIAALTRQVLDDAWQDYREQLLSLGATPLQSAMTLLWDCRLSLLTTLAAGFGRAIAEVGAVLIVGGNIDGVTRVMTTTIALETSKGDLPLALALGLLLVALVLGLNLMAYEIRRYAERKYG